MATVEITQHLKVTIGGVVKEFGDTETPVEFTITNGHTFEVRAQVDDDYTEETLWESGDANFDTFELLWFTSDADILLEFADADSTECFAIQVYADIPLILSYDDILVSDSAASIITEDATTMKTIDKILAKNNGADAAGDITVHLVLFN